MAFQYDQKTISAVDTEKNIRIRGSTKFYDIADEFFFVYKSPNLEFEFSATELREKRSLLVNGQLVESLVATACFIVEPSIRKGLTNALRGETIDQKNYEDIKNDVVVGMFTLSTRGGKLLSTVPDYRVEFVKKP
ncbi:hypothetical protein [Collimonas arenae]|uniref:hypothetical protein n=1 Tax=Collimonas arenae TaxID=279058 RepID=UPI0007787A86|nr:hypothetical protein [Collimonas arenae]